MPMNTAPTGPRVSRARLRAALSIVAIVALSAVAVFLVVRSLSRPALAQPDSPFDVTFIDSIRGSDTTPLIAPMGAAAAFGRLYVADPRAGIVAVFGDDGLLERSIGAEVLSEPTGVAVDTASRTIWVADHGAREIRAFTRNGRARTVFAPRDGAGGAARDLAAWRPCAVAAAAGRLYVADLQAQRVVAFDADGRWVAQYGATGTVEAGRLSYPVSLTVAGGELFVADGNNRRIAVFDALTGEYRRALPVPGVPRGVTALEGGSRLIVADATSSEGRIVDSRTGSLLASFGASENPDSRLTRPHGLVVVGDRFYVVDAGSARVGIWRWIDRTGTDSAQLSAEDGVL